MHRCPRLGSPHHCPSGCLGMQAQRQTSTHAGNIPSSYGNPCKLNPCPSVCYLHVLTKAQGKGTWALPEILPRLWTTIWQRKAVWKTLFQNKSSGTINPVYLPRKLLNNTKNVSIKKHCLSQLLPNIFILPLMRNIPLTTMTSIVFCFGNHAVERSASSCTKLRNRPWTM